MDRSKLIGEGHHTEMYAVLTRWGGASPKLIKKIGEEKNQEGTGGGSVTRMFNQHSE